MNVKASHAKFYLRAAVVFIFALLTAGCEESKYKVIDVKIIGHPVACNTVSALDGLVIKKDGQPDGNIPIHSGKMCAVAEVKVARLKPFKPEARGQKAKLFAYFTYWSTATPRAEPDKWLYYEVADTGQDVIVFPRVIVVYAYDERYYNEMKEAKATRGMDVYFGTHDRRGNVTARLCCFAPNDPDNKIDCTSLCP